MELALFVRRIGPVGPELRLAEAVYDNNCGAHCVLTVVSCWCLVTKVFPSFISYHALKNSICFIFDIAVLKYVIN